MAKDGAKIKTINGEEYLVVTIRGEVAKALTGRNSYELWTPMRLVEERRREREAKS